MAIQQLLRNRSDTLSTVLRGGGCSLREGVQREDVSPHCNLTTASREVFSGFREIVHLGKLSTCFGGEVCLLDVHVCSSVVFVVHLGVGDVYFII